MIVPAAQQTDVQIHKSRRSHRPEEILQESRSKVGQFFCRRGASYFYVGTTGKIERDIRQRLVHCEQEKPITLDSLFIAQGFNQRLTQRDPDVLHQMVCVNMRVAGGLNF